MRQKIIEIKGGSQNYKTKKDSNKMIKIIFF